MSSDQMSEGSIPDLITLSKIPVNYAQKIETDLLEPVVFNNNASRPIAVLKSAVVLSLKEFIPNAELPVPVVFAAKELLPTAVLLAPVLNFNA